MQNRVRILETVKVDKLSFGIISVTPPLEYKLDKVIQKYYEEFSRDNNFNKLYREVTPTKQRREGYNDFNHNLQMIPLEQFLLFLKELRNAVGHDLNVYEIHLTKDILVEVDTNVYMNTLLDHEYMNGYHAYKEEADSPNTIYISRKKDLNSDNNLKLRIKFYDKIKQILHKKKIEKLPLKEPIEELETEFIDEKMFLSLKDLNLLRCEIELRENYLPYTTIEQIIEAIENETFQDTVEKHYNQILNKTVFDEPKQKKSCSSLKQVAIKLMRESNRDYKTLFNNIGMSREYNYFKHTKEMMIRENNPSFNELKEKLISKGFYESS